MYILKLVFAYGFSTTATLQSHMSYQGSDYVRKRMTKLYIICCVGGVFWNSGGLFFFFFSFGKILFFSFPADGEKV